MSTRTLSGSGSGGRSGDGYVYVLDASLVAGTFTVDVYPGFASTSGVNGDTHWVLDFGAATDGLRLRKDATGWFAETVDVSAGVSTSGYLTFAANTRLRITVESLLSRIMVDDVSGGIAAPLVWPGSGTLRIDGTWGAISKPEQGASAMSPSVNTNCPFGDSITVGGASTNNNGYKLRISVLAIAAGYRYQNVGPFRTGSPVTADICHAGVNGNNIAAMQARLATDVVAYRSRFTTIHAGTNDMGGSVPAALVNMTSLLTALRAASTTKVILCEIPPRVGWEASVITFNAGLQDALNAAGYTAADSILVSPGVTLAECGDGVHPGDVGHDKIAAAAWTGALALGVV